MIELVDLLKKNNKTVSSMESCTGGGFVNALTNVEGASEVIKFSAVTYSNEYKIKMGVNEEVINKYTVYSMNTAIEMSYSIAKYSNSNYGVGITGKLNRVDINNPYGKDNIVYISIYDRDNNKFYNNEVMITKSNRVENKKIVIDYITNLLKDIIKE